MTRLGLNLSFCVKRWAEPEHWTAVMREDFGLSLAQLSFDLLDPWWPEDLRFKLARRTRRACQRNDVELHSAFVGLASYTYNHLLHPSPEGREAGFAWFRRAIDLASELEVPATGGPLGAVGADTSANAEQDAGEYRRYLDTIEALAEHARRRGLSEFLIEPTPLKREIPHSVDGAVQLMQDLEGRTAVPVRYCLDWGHHIITFFYGEGASMRPWLERCGPWTSQIHLQQSDGALDRHWSFASEGIVQPGQVARDLEETGLANLPAFLEAMYPFEMTDGAVKQDMQAAIQALRPHFST